MESHDIMKIQGPNKKKDDMQSEHEVYTLYVSGSYQDICFISCFAKWFTFVFLILKFNISYLSSN